MRKGKGEKEAGAGLSPRRILTVDHIICSHKLRSVEGKNGWNRLLFFFFSLALSPSLSFSLYFCLLM